MPEKKLRRSRQRDEILRYLQRSAEHPSAEQIYVDLKSEMKGLSLGTVYRNLALLEKLGKIRSIGTVNNVVRYDACLKDQAHFICEKCGRVVDVVGVDLQALQQTLRRDCQHDVRRIDVTLYGVCSDCESK